MEKFGAECGTQTQCKNVRQWVCPQQQETSQSRYRRAVPDKKDSSKKFILGDKKKTWSPYRVASEDGNKKYKRSVEEIKGLKQEVLDESFDGAEGIINAAVNTKAESVSGAKALIKQTIQAKSDTKQALLEKSLTTVDVTKRGKQAFITNVAAGVRKLKGAVASKARSLKVFNNIFLIFMITFKPNPMNQLLY